MRQRRFLLAHVAIIIALALTVLVSFYTSEDASVGGGLALVILTALGLPWSIAPAVAFDVNGDWPSTLAYAALALLNALALHWAGVRIRRTRPS